MAKPHRKCLRKLPPPPLMSLDIFSAPYKVQWLRAFHLRGTTAARVFFRVMSVDFVRVPCIMHGAHVYAHQPTLPRPASGANLCASYLFDTVHFLKTRHSLQDFGHEMWREGAYPWGWPVPRTLRHYSCGITNVNGTSFCALSSVTVHCLFSNSPHSKVKTRMNYIRRFKKRISYSQGRSPPRQHLFANL